MIATPVLASKVQPAHIIINSDNIWTFIFEKSCCTVRYGNVAWSTGRRQLLELPATCLHLISSERWDDGDRVESRCPCVGGQGLAGAEAGLMEGAPRSARIEPE